MCKIYKLELYIIVNLEPHLNETRFPTARRVVSYLIAFFKNKFLLQKAGGKNTNFHSRI